MFILIAADFIKILKVFIKQMNTANR